MLITEAPKARARTHGPTLLNSASVPLGLSAPTATIGTAFGSVGTIVCFTSGHGHQAAGKTNLSVASLPAEQTTATPHSPSSRRMSYIVEIKTTPYSGVSW